MGAVALAWLGAAGNDVLHAPGPMNTNHHDVACAACHREAPGSLRQQLQTAARDLVGMSASDVDVGYREVTNQVCLECHDRPEDRHPVFRFLEPRFAQVRAVLAPQNCSSCHREHHGVRVTVPETTFCRHCHGELTMKADPLDVSHQELVAGGRWDTCLGCHDFHGNHPIRTPRRIEDVVPQSQIQDYFDGGRSPYPDVVRKATRKEVIAP